MKSLLIASVVALLCPFVTHANEAWNHDDIKPIPEKVPAGPIGQRDWDYRPYLFVHNGCVPFPAVDQWGHPSKGLKPTGASNGGCSHIPGQVYVRSGWYRGVWAIMYSWYFPKDSPSSGLGHRHDWESIVVWINNPSVPRPTVYALSYSAHGNYSYLRNPAASLRDNHPKVVYGSTWPTNHEMFIGPYNPVGGMQPLIAWESMDQWVKDALTYTNFGAANVPFIDNNFNQNLGKAWYYN